MTPLHPYHWQITTLKIFLPILALCILVLYGINRNAHSIQLRKLLHNDTNHIELISNDVRRVLHEIRDDIGYLGGLASKGNAADTGTLTPGRSNIAMARKALQGFLTYRGRYQRATILGADGHVWIHAETGHQDSMARIPPMQPIRTLRALTPGEIRVQIQNPPETPNEGAGNNSVLHILAGLFDDSQQPLGTLILDYPARQLGALMHHDRTTGTSPLLIGSNEMWLAYADPLDQTPGLGAAFSQSHPDLWRAIQDDPEGHREFAGRRYLWAAIDLAGTPETNAARGNIVDADGKPLRYWAVIRRSPNTLNAWIGDTTLLLTTILLTLVASLVLARYRTDLVRSRRNRELLHETQRLTSTLLQSGLESRPLADEMLCALEHILAMSWVSIQAKGSIFLKDPTADELVMVAQKNLAPPLLSRCARLRLGECLCGQAAASGEMVFASCVDHRHEIRFDGMAEHGHICVPMLNGAQLSGVINLYVEHGHRYNPIYPDILGTIASAVAAVVERKRTDQELVQAHRTVSAQRDQLAFERSVVEETLAMIRDSEKFDGRHVRYLMEAVDNTAGDILLAAQRPDGVCHYLLGDFTGHGLPSALAAPTVADIFYSMTAKGIDPNQILAEINGKLHEKLPPRLFLAGCFAAFDPHSRQITIWNAGLPSALLLRAGQEVRRFASAALPLGIVTDNRFDSGGESTTLTPGDRVYIFSDGVVEPANAEGQMFGIERLSAVLSKVVHDDMDLQYVVTQVTEYQTSTEHTDDITLLEIST